MIREDEKCGSIFAGRRIYTSKYERRVIKEVFLIGR